MIILTRPQSFSISKVSRKKGAVKKMQTKAFVLIGTRIQEQYSCSHFSNVLRTFNQYQVDRRGEKKTTNKYQPHQLT